MRDDATPAAWAFHTDVGLDEVNRVLPALEAAGLLGLVEEHGATTVYFPEQVDALPLAGEWEPVPDTDWLSAWKAGLEPITIGAMTIAPPWAATPGDLVIEPGQAFGTGHHETTAGCLEVLQELAPGGRSLLDVGTGSGVLAIAGARAGAAPVVAVDTDPAAVAATRRNAAVNGSALDVREGTVEVVTGRFDIVLANLDTATVTRSAAALAERLARDGVLVVAGVSLEREGEAARALRAMGLDVACRRGREWTMLVARHPVAS